MAVRLFVGNLSYATTEADLRTYFGTVAPPSQVVLPVDRETGRPRGFAFVEYTDRTHAEQAIQQFNGQPFNGRPLAVSEARAREDRGPGGFRPSGPSGPPRPGGFAPRPPSSFGGPPRPFDPSAPAAPRSRNFGPDARPQRGGSAEAKKKAAKIGGTIDVTTATLDAPETFPPSREIWLEHRLAWEPLDENLAHFQRSSSGDAA